MVDEQEDFDAERHDLMTEIQRDRAAGAKLRRKLGLARLIINNFVPRRFQRQLVARARVNANTGAWELPALELAGNNVQPRPVTVGDKYVQTATRPGRGATLQLPLDVMEPTTRVRKQRRACVS